MLRNSWFIAGRDVRYTLKSREALLWILVMPIVFFYFIGTVTRGGGLSTGETREVLAVQAPEGAGFLADQVIARLEENHYRVVRPAPKEFPAYSRRLVFPEDFTARVLKGEKTSLRLERSEAGIAQDLDRVRVARSAYTTLADLLAAEAAGEEPNASSFARLHEMPRSLTLEVSPAGKRPKIPTGFEQAIPGIMVMFTLVVLLTSGAVPIVIERKTGLLRRLASTPLSRSSIVLGKWGGKMALACVQIAFAMLAGTVLFAMDWGPDLGMIFLVMLAWGALCASLGLLLANMVKSEGQAVAVGVLAGNVLAALGGCWWPIEITPGWMQTLARFLPTGWAMDALHRLISFQAGPLSAIPHVLVMLSAAAFLGWLSARSFRFE